MISYKTSESAFSQQNYEFLFPDLGPHLLEYKIFYVAFSAFSEMFLGLQ